EGLSGAGALNTVIAYEGALLALGWTASQNGAVWASETGERWCLISNHAIFDSSWIHGAEVIDDRFVLIGHANDDAAVWVGDRTSESFEPCAGMPSTSPEPARPGPAEPAPPHIGGLVCAESDQRSFAFFAGDAPSPWGELPAGSHIRVVASLWDDGAHEEEPVGNSERVRLELDNGYVSPPSPDLPNEVHEIIIDLGDFAVGDASRWRIIHSDDPANGTPDSIHAIVEVFGCELRP
ncbi:MAG: hypothetical protein P8N02_18945, partial [Actinomycetota bacterium]|nr:hypothetical protein [Actinomycetota bacterium]